MLVWLLQSACTPAPAPPPAASATASSGEPLHVVVSIRPQAFLIQRIGGAHVRPIVLIGPAQSHHIFDPTPRQLTEIGRATAYFRIGLSFEQSLTPKLASLFPNLRIVDTQAGIKLRPMKEGCCDHAGHDHAADHSDHSTEGQPDPHIWLDPQLAKLQAGTIANALCELAPAHADQFRNNLSTLASELDRVDAEVAARLAPLKGSSFFVFHPSYGYFADRYGLTQVAVEIEGRSPTARELLQLTEQARRAQIKAIFVQPQFSKNAAEMLARSLNASVVELDPLAEDYIENLKRMSERLAANIAPPARSERMPGGQAVLATHTNVAHFTLERSPPRSASCARTAEAAAAHATPTKSRGDTTPLRASEHS